jgi:hypothetical protein
MNIKYTSKKICKVVKYVLNTYLVHNWDSLGFCLLDQQSRIHCPDPESANLDLCDPDLQRHVPCRGSGNLGCPDPDEGGETYRGRDLDEWLRQDLEYRDYWYDPDECECSVAPGC